MTWAISRSPCEVYRSMKWVVESPLMAVTQQNEKMTICVGRVLKSFILWSAQ
ncbi:unnamed protein product [Spirodela intermedia]|uniref:Uncharacterized protein n=1 Tax=Spirodela intermedia TaxID=51605 RepID=A0A7I8JMK4_SPIIN|nr:unnamed protein product [Spirodela intermedia]CAA6670813.1 unnamed protein product [Spirodela intermedia]